MERPGIYQVASKTDPSKTFVFLAVDINSKWNAELDKLRSGIHENKKLQDHFDEFGADDLQHSLVEACSKYNWHVYLEAYIKNMNPYFNSTKKTSKKVKENED
jgi:hypothetical protein